MGKAGKSIRRWLWRMVAALVVSTVAAVVLYSFVPVFVTPLMLIRVVEQLQQGGEVRLRHSWVPLRAMSASLPLAVVCSEDQNFLDHAGFDFQAIRQVVAESRKKPGRRLRGASTISQQTAKNVFLWPGRSWLRKGLEVYFTVLIELLWSKERILEVYLNSIEMGDGIYGAQAAANHYFGKHAGKLSRRESAAIAAVLPNPRKYTAHPPGPYVRQRIAWISGQMRRFGTLHFD